MKTETISYLKQNAASLDVEEPIVITQSGKPVYRVESEQSARLRDEGLALLKLMNIAERDIAAGNTMTPDEAIAKLRQRIRSGKHEI